MQILPNGIKKVGPNDNVTVGNINRNDDLLDQKIGELNALQQTVGDMSKVPTNAKTVAGAITELFTSVSDGKALVAGAITDKGVPTSPSDTFQQMADNIRAIRTGPDTSDATAAAADILAGKVAYGAGDQRLVGTMPNRGNVLQTLTNQGQEYTIPAGYHAGGGKVTANISNLSAPNIKYGATVGGMAGTFSQTANGASAGQILSGREAFVNGAQVVGTMPNRTGHVTGQSISRSGTTLRIRPQPGYYPGDSGNSVQWNDPNWVAQNIREGVSIFGLTGTLTERKFASGTVTAAMTGVIDVSRLSFQPVLVVIQGITQTSEIAILNSLSYIKVFLFDSGVNNTSYINFTSDNYIEPDGFIITYSYFANHQFSWWAWG